MRDVATARARLGDDGREPSLLILVRRVRHRDLRRPLIDRLLDVRVVVAGAGGLGHPGVQGRLLIRAVALDDVLVDTGDVVPVTVRLRDLAGQNPGRQAPGIQGAASLVLSGRRVLNDDARRSCERARITLQPVLPVLSGRDLDDLGLLGAVPFAPRALGAGVVELPTLNDEAVSVQALPVQKGRKALVGPQVRSGRADWATRRSYRAREQAHREGWKEQGSLSRHFASLGRM